MNEHIDKYLATVDRALRRHLPAGVVDDRIKELRSHLVLAIRNLVDLGSTEEQAALRATADLGSPRLIADDLIYQHRGYRHKSVWLLALLPVALILLAEVAVYTLNPGQPSTGMWWYFAMRYSGAVVFPVFAWQVWRSRRWLVAPVAAFTFLLCALPMMNFYATHVMYGVGATHEVSRRSDLVAYRDNLRMQVSALGGELKMAQDTLASVRAGGHAPIRSGMAFVPYSNEVYQTASVPGGLFPASHRDGTTYFAAKVHLVTQEDADQRWRDDGPRAIANMQTDLAQAQALLSTWQSGPPFDWNALLAGITLFAASLAIQIVLLTAVNWLVLFASDTRRRRLGRAVPIG